MAKSPSIWTARDGSSTVTQLSGVLLLESADILLLEDNASFLLLENVSLALKETSQWDNLTIKSSSWWASQDGSSLANNSNTNTQRIQQDGSVRMLQDGTTIRVFQETVYTPKRTTKWDDI